jgi:membrane-associated phospholipid phosphatase
VQWPPLASSHASAMFSSATLLLLVMAASTALLVAIAARLLVRGDRRFVGRGAVGLRLVVSVLIALLALWLFGEIADNVIDHDELTRFDAGVMSALAPLRTPAGLAVAQAVSFCARVPAMTAVALLVAATVHRRNWRAVLVGWTLVIGGGQLVEGVLKQSYQRVRPPGAGQFIGDASYSYPSGHSMAAMIGFGLLAYLLVIRVRRPAARVAIAIAAAAMILAVGVSRLVLGVHYFTDVVGGYAAGAVWLLLAIAAVESERRRWQPMDASARAAA